MKFIIYLLFIFVLILQIPIVAGVTNSGFETGDLFGWFEVGSVTVGTDYAYTGEYGVRVKTPGAPTSWVGQQITLGDTVSFDIKILDTSVDTIGVHWQGTNPTGNFKLAEYSSTCGWTRKYIDTSDKNGYVGILKFSVSSYTLGAEFWLDDVSTTEPQPATLSGWVDNNLGGDVSSATITLNQSGGETTTNDIGFYSISDVAANTYLITVTKPGYNDYFDTVVISEDTTKNITLTYKTPELTSLSILDSGDNSLLLGWRESLGADGVYVYVDSQTNLVATVETPYTNIKMYDLTNLEPGTSYNIWCKPYKDDLQGSMYYVSGTTTGGSGGGGGAPEVLPPYEDIQPEIPEYPITYDPRNITSEEFVILMAKNPQLIYSALFDKKIVSPTLDKSNKNLWYFYLMIISIFGILYDIKKKEKYNLAKICIVTLIISLIKLNWI